MTSRELCSRCGVRKPGCIRAGCPWSEATPAGPFFILTDYEQTAAEADTLDEARAKAQAIFRSDALQINVSIHDTAGELVEDLGRSPGAPLVNLARNLRRSKP